jgi:hypothetical protein
VTESQRRPVPRLAADELENAISFLDFQREAVLIKCAGLSEEQLRRVQVPSGTNLLGLVQHLTGAEYGWFTAHVADEASDEPDWPGADVPADLAPETVFRRYREQWAHSNAIVRRIGDPDALTARPIDDEPLPLRWVLAHMLTETARHAGHADILRENLDGITGR